jgi:TIR domain-containing protein
MVPHPNEVFLSYSTLDWRFADEIAKLLRRHNIQLWDSRSSILPSQDWHDEIGRALRRCDWFTILLSPDSINSAWVHRELMFALSQRRLTGRIVPVVIRACDDDELPWSLFSSQLVDFTEDFEKGCRALLRIWGIGYQAIDA